MRRCAFAGRRGSASSTLAERLRSWTSGRAVRPALRSRPAACRVMTIGCASLAASVRVAEVVAATVTIRLRRAGLQVRRRGAGASSTQPGLRRRPSARPAAASAAAAREAAASEQRAAGAVDRGDELHRRHALSGLCAACVAFLAFLAGAVFLLRLRFTRGALVLVLIFLQAFSAFASFCARVSGLGVGWFLVFGAAAPCAVAGARAPEPCRGRRRRRRARRRAGAAAFARCTAAGAAAGGGRSSAPGCAAHARVVDVEVVSVSLRRRAGRR